MRGILIFDASAESSDVRCWDDMLRNSLVLTGHVVGCLALVACQG